jgi:hypothetical protein
MSPSGGDSEPTTDLDVTLAIFRECEGALAALQGAIRRAREIYPGLSRVARDESDRQLAGLCRRTGLLVLRLGFPGYLTANEKE